MKRAHTPGPWFVAPDPGHRCEECGSNSAVKHMVGWRLSSGCVVGLATVLTDDQEDANAHLISAAPCLLAVAKGYEKWEADLILCDEAWGPNSCRQFPQLTAALYDRLMELQAMRNAAIAKSKGDSP